MELVLLQWSARKAPRIQGYRASGDCPTDPRIGIAANPAGCSFSEPMLREIRNANQFAGVAAFANSGPLSMTRNGTARMVNGQLVSGDFFQTLGVKPVAGRVLEMSDDSPTAVPVAVLNYGFWQSAFGGSRGRSQGCGARYARKYAETLTARQVRKLVSRFASVWAVYCPRVSRLIVIHSVAKPATSLLWSFRLNDLES